MCDDDAGGWELVIVLIVLHLHEDEEDSVEEDDTQQLDLDGKLEFLLELLLAPLPELFEPVYLRHTQYLEQDPYYQDHNYDSQGESSIAQKRKISDSVIFFAWDCFSQDCCWDGIHRR